MKLTDLVRQPGPFATVHIDASHDTEDALDLSAQRWHGAESALVKAGADPESIAVLADAWTGAPAAGRTGRLMVADRSRLLLDVALPVPPPQTVVRWGVLPYLLPALAAGPHPPHVVLVVDKNGMDYRVVTPGGVTEDAVDGDGGQVHKVPGGGWSHLSMQRHVEENVRRTMRTAAETAVAAARGAGARLVAVAGEVRSRAALRAELPDSLHAVELEAGSRAPGADAERLELQVASALAEIDAADHMADLDQFHVHTGGRAVDGLPDVLAALAEANAELLLMPRSLPGTARVRPGDPQSIGDDGEECQLDEALPAAALAVGGRVRVVGPEIELRDRVGVLRRYA